MATEYKETYKLIDTIILNGKVGLCPTGDENDETIGVSVTQKVKRLNGQIMDTVVDSFALTKEMADKCNWSGNYANIQMLFGDTPIDMDNLDETKIVSMMGDVTSYYYHSYSELTGYLWTEECFKCGGHDIRQILSTHVGEYVHLEIELYKKVLEKV